MCAMRGATKARKPEPPRKAKEKGTQRDTREALRQGRPRTKGRGLVLPRLVLFSWDQDQDMGPINSQVPSNIPMLVSFAH